MVFLKSGLEFIRIKDFEISRGEDTMESERITIRIPAPLMRASEKKAAAAGMSVGEWARMLMEDATGVKVEIRQGTATMTKRKLKEVSRAGVVGRHGAK
jgi:hypothetical protein